MKTVIIRYPFAWGGQIKDRGFWEAKIEGESNVWDYDSKENLKKKAEKKGYHWKVLRYHKNGKISVIEHKQKDDKLTICENCGKKMNIAKDVMGEKILGLYCTNTKCSECCVIVNGK